MSATIADGSGIPADSRPLPDEPLALSAPLALALAGELCRVDPVQGGSCAWYHGFRQYLRMLDIVATPQHDAGFFRAALQPLIRAGHRRVLISGAADYAMLAQLLAIFRHEGAEPVITALDLCRTPLRLSEWYAARMGAAIETVAADVLDYRPVETFDLVCTHSLFGRFAASERPALIARWHALLRPGGCVVTVNRIRPDAPDTVQSTDAEVERFVARVQAAMARTGLAFDIPLDRFLAMSRRYAADMQVHPVRSADELGRQFQAAGFAIEHLALGPAEGRAREASAGPTVAGGKNYVRVVARRPMR